MIKKLRNGEEIELWAHYESGSARVKVRPFTEAETGKNGPAWQEVVLCVFSKRLRVMIFNDDERNGFKVSDTYRLGVIPKKRILGVVEKVFEIKNTPSLLVSALRGNLL